MSPSSSPPPPPPQVMEDCAGLIKLYSDGSILRSPDPLFPIPIDDHNHNVLWKQLDFQPHSNHNLLRLRLFKPRYTAAKLPVLLYLHGGGFCFGSCSWPHVHNCCLRLASDLNALVLGLDYRLAPEHRLPAAVDDAAAALAWLRAQAASADPDEFLADAAADYENVVVMGDSSGGNIAHHLAVRLGSAAEPDAEPDPIRVRKYILLGPFFGGTRRTRSEMDCPEDAVMNLALIDQFWRLAVPLGADADHPLANPDDAASLEAVGFEAMLVVVGELDLLRDRAVEYAERLKELGKPVELVEFQGQEHGFFTDRPTSQAASDLVAVLKRFLYKKNT